MVYTPEEKQRMDTLLDAFQGYLDNRNDMDVVYSDKLGFVRLITARESDSVFFPIRGYDDLLEMFIIDHLQDEEERAESRIGMEYNRVREHLLPILRSLGPDAAYAIQAMELCLSLWQHSAPASSRRHLTLLPRQKKQPENE